MKLRGDGKANKEKGGAEKALSVAASRDEEDNILQSHTGR